MTEDEKEVKRVSYFAKQLEISLTDEIAFSFFDFRDFKEAFGLVDNDETLIDKLIKNRRPFSAMGICSCDSGFMCEHRKKYLVRMCTELFIRSTNVDWNENGIETTKIQGE